MESCQHGLHSDFITKVDKSVPNDLWRQSGWRCLGAFWKSSHLHLVPWQRFCCSKYKPFGFLYHNVVLYNMPFCIICYTAWIVFHFKQTQVKKRNVVCSTSGLLRLEDTKHPEPTSRSHCFLPWLWGSRAEIRPSRVLMITRDLQIEHKNFKLFANQSVHYKGFLRTDSTFRGEELCFGLFIWLFIWTKDNY